MSQKSQKDNKVYIFFLEKNILSAFQSIFTKTLKLQCNYLFLLNEKLAQNNERQKLEKLSQNDIKLLLSLYLLLLSYIYQQKTLYFSKQQTRKTQLYKTHTKTVIIQYTILQITYPILNFPEFQIINFWYLNYFLRFIQFSQHSICTLHLQSKHYIINLTSIISEKWIIILISHPFPNWMPCILQPQYFILQNMINLIQKQYSLHQLPTIISSSSQPEIKIKFRKPRTYTWTLLEQEIYLNFLKENIKSMLTSLSRRTNKVFKVLSKIIKTRNAIQVKTHHQKLQKKFGCIYSIISHLQDYIQCSKLKQKGKQINAYDITDEQGSLRSIKTHTYNQYDLFDQFQHVQDKCQASSQIPKLMFSIEEVTQKLVFVYANEGDDDFLYV